MADVDEQTQHIYDHVLKVRGNVPNVFMETGTLGAKLKELVITCTSQINRSEY